MGTEFWRIFKRIHTFLFALVFVTLSVPAAQASENAGVVDLQDKTIIPFEYSNIEYLGNGLYKCFEQTMELANSTAPRLVRQPYSFKILNSDGKEIQLNFPSAFQLVRIYIPDSYPKEDKHLNALPANAFIEVKGPKGLGLWKSTGERVIEPEYFQISVNDFVTAKVIKIDSSGEKIFEEIKIGEPPEIKLTHDTIPSDNGLTIFAEKSNKPEDKLGFRFLHSGKVNEPSKRIATETNYPIRFGYENENSKVVIPAIYTEARNFHKGIAIVKTSKPTEISEFQYIDKSGKQTSPIFWRAQPFKHGRAVVAVNDNSAIPYPGKYIGTGIFGRFGVVNEKFKFVIQPNFAEVRNVFPNRYLATPIGGEPSKLYNRNGKLITKLPMRISSFEKLTSNSWIASVSNFDSSQATSQVVFNENFEVIATLPPHSNILRKNEHSIIYSTSSGNSNTDGKTGQELVFCDQHAIKKKVLAFRGQISRLYFHHDLIVLPLESDEFQAAKGLSRASFQGVANTAGEWVIEPQGAEFKIAEADRIIKQWRPILPNEPMSRKQ